MFYNYKYDQGDLYVFIFRVYNSAWSADEIVLLGNFYFILFKCLHYWKAKNFEFPGSFSGFLESRSKTYLQNCKKLQT